MLAISVFPVINGVADRALLAVNLGQLLIDCFVARPQHSELSRHVLPLMFKSDRVSVERPKPRLEIHRVARDSRVEIHQFQGINPEEASQLRQFA